MYFFHKLQRDWKHNNWPSKRMLIVSKHVTIHDTFENTTLSTFWVQLASFYDSIKKVQTLTPSKSHANTYSTVFWMESGFIFGRCWLLIWYGGMIIINRSNQFYQGPTQSVKFKLNTAIDLKLHENVLMLNKNHSIPLTKHNNFFHCQFFISEQYILHNWKIYKIYKL